MTPSSVVITGIGLIAPNGGSTNQVWDNCRAGVTHVEPVPRHWLRFAPLASTIWAPAPSIEYDGSFVNRIEAMQMDRATLLGLRAAQEAISHAGLRLSPADERKNTFVVEGIDPLRWGVFVGTGMGGITSFSGAQSAHCAAAFDAVLDNSGKTVVREVLRPPMRFNPFVVSMVMPNASAAQLGIKLSLLGANRTCTQACAAGTCAIGDAFAAIVSGSLDGAIAGGVEFLADEYGGIMRGFDVAKSLAVSDGPGEKANRPFDEKRTGFLFAGGGAGMLVLESAENARRRGVVPIASIAAAAESFDAHSIMAMEPEGRAAQQMILAALDMAGVRPQEIDYINAHGTGTKLNDETEAALIDRMFGTKPFVNSTKSIIGHTIGASGAIEAGITALSIRDEVLHPSLNIDTPVRNLRFVREPLRTPVSAAISQSFAFGGHNACLVVTRARA